MSTTSIIKQTQKSIMSRECSPKTIATCRTCHRGHTASDVAAKSPRRTVVGGMAIVSFDCQCGERILMSDYKGSLAQVSSDDVGSEAITAIDKSLQARAEIVKARDHFRAARAAAKGTSGYTEQTPISDAMSTMTAEIIKSMTRIADSYGVQSKRSPSAAGFLEELKSVCAALAKDAEDARATLEEMQCACSAVISGEVSSSSDFTQILSADAMRPILVSIHKAADSAAKKLLGKRIEEVEGA